MHTTLRLAAVIGILAVGVTAVLWIFGVDSFSQLQTGLGKTLGVIVVLTGVVFGIQGLLHKDSNPPSAPKM